MPAPTVTTIKRLFLLTGNRCAFPGCTQPLVNGSGALVGEVCHICADKPGGKRYDPAQREEERQSYVNLIVLCGTHHTIVDDDEVTYTADVLREMKRKHEAAATQYVISDRVAERVVLILGGAGLGNFAGEIARGFREVLEAISGALPSGPAKESSFKKELIDVLRYAPHGVVRYFCRDPLHLQVGSFFLEVFRAAGWRIQQLSEAQLNAWPRRTRRRSEMVFLFTINDRHQILIAQRALEEVFQRCGFEYVQDGDAYHAENSSGIRITFSLAFNARH